MADLPHDRLKEEPQFNHCGVDIFGPFLIKEIRNTLKQYGALFTCLASRAIHIKMIKSFHDFTKFAVTLKVSLERFSHMKYCFY